MPKFKVHDESLNSYGFWVLTEGGDFSQFRKNPVMLWMHREPSRWGDNRETLPIGRWAAFEVKDRELFADPEFDEDDDFAVTIRKKVDKGIINMASIGLEIIETSTDQKYMKPGQTRPTVIKWRLMEISICPFGANDNALRLYKDGQMLRITSDNDPVLLSAFNQPTIKKPSMEKHFKNIALALGLSEDASEADIMAEINKNKGTMVSLTTDNANLKKRVDQIVEKQITDMVDEASDKQKKFTADKKSKYVEMGKALGIETLKSVLDDMPSAVKPLDLIRETSEGRTGLSKQADWTYADWQEKDGHTLMKMADDTHEDHDLFKKLFKAHYGFEYQGK